MTTVIYDPACPPTIFDGLLPVHSTCCTCGELMTVTVAEYKHHPMCDRPAPSGTEVLIARWLSAVEHGDSEKERALAAELRAVDRTPDLGAAAVQYAQWGWPVFPLAQHSKMPAIPKRKGGQGFKDATSDPDRIKAWWTRHPEHNIGLATGHAFDVIDVDTKDSDGRPCTVGNVSFSKLLHDHNLPDCHGIAITASGGLHLYGLPKGKGNYAGIRPGIDYRGKGGYVVAPPSWLARGRTYTWLTVPSPMLKGQ